MTTGDRDLASLMDWIRGTTGDDDLRGTNDRDVMIGDAGNDELRGRGGDDEINGGNGDDMLFGGAGNDLMMGANGNDVVKGGKGDDRVGGGDGDDMLYGQAGDDTLSGGDGDDELRGGRGNDILESGLGDDIVIAGGGDDTVYAFSWAGEPVIAQSPTTPKVEPAEPLSDDDVITLGGGADTLVFRWLIDAKRDILEKHRGDDGDINYRAVAGENNNLHDHWVESMGDKVVRDFREGTDTVIFEGHTLQLRSASIVDADQDGQLDDTILNFYSNQPNGGAHDEDDLGSVSFLNVQWDASDVTTNAGVFYGVTAPFIDDA